MMSISRSAAGARLFAAVTKSPGALHGLTAVKLLHTSREMSSSTSSGDLLISKSEGLMTIQVNRPSKLNAITQDMYLGIAEALESAKNDAATRMVLLTGSGKYYSAGVDLSFYEDAADRVAALKESTKRLETFLTSFIDFPKPLVAGVNGPAIGIMVTTLALADIVWCSPTATFSTPFAVTCQSPEGCSSMLFHMILGRSLANEMLMLNRKLDANEALHKGLVSRIVASEGDQDFLERVTHDLKQAIANYSTESMAASKSLIFNEDARNELKKVMKQENAVLNERMMTEEFTSFITKFLSKGKKKA